MVSYEDRVIAASHDLEGIAIIAKHMVTELREGIDRPYARVYWLRREMSRIVATLGAGQPQGLKEIEAHYEKIVAE